MGCGGAFVRNREEGGVDSDGGCKSVEEGCVAHGATSEKVAERGGENKGAGDDLTMDLQFESEEPVLRAFSRTFPEIVTELQDDPSLRRRRADWNGRGAGAAAGGDLATGRLGDLDQVGGSASRQVARWRGSEDAKRRMPREASKPCLQARNLRGVHLREAEALLA